MGYRHEPDKFAAAGLTPAASHEVAPPRIAECPVQLEAALTESRPLGTWDHTRPSTAVAIEVRVVRVHVDESILMAGHENRIDPVKWRPLIMSFCEFFGLGAKVHTSRLAEIPETAYTPAHLRERQEARSQQVARSPHEVGSEREAVPSAAGAALSTMTSA
jgi:hypothetical protein